MQQESQCLRPPGASIPSCSLNGRQDSVVGDKVGEGVSLRQPFCNAQYKNTWWCIADTFRFLMGINVSADVRGGALLRMMCMRSMCENFNDTGQIKACEGNSGVRCGGGVRGMLNRYRSHILVHLKPWKETYYKNSI